MIAMLMVGIIGKVGVTVIVYLIDPKLPLQNIQNLVQYGYAYDHESARKIRACTH
jgi:hypothetical protein